MAPFIVFRGLFVVIKIDRVRVTDQTKILLIKQR